MRLKLIFLLVFVFAISALSVYYFAGWNNDLNKKSIILPFPTGNNSTSINLKPTNTISWNIPDLPRGYDWQEKRTSLDSNGESEYFMYWDMTGGENLYGQINFPTTVYFTDLTFQDREEIIDYHVFANEFFKDLEINGWTPSVYGGNIRIIGPAADGVFSTIYGLTKILNNQVRSVGYSYNLIPVSWEDPSSEIKCPCNLHLEIFVGDPINLIDIK